MKLKIKLNLDNKFSNIKEYNLDLEEIIIK